MDYLCGASRVQNWHPPLAPTSSASLETLITATHKLSTFCWASTQQNVGHATYWVEVSSACSGKFTYDLQSLYCYSLMDPCCPPLLQLSSEVTSYSMKQCGCSNLLVLLSHTRTDSVLYNRSARLRYTHRHTRPPSLKGRGWVGCGCTHQTY